VLIVETNLPEPAPQVSVVIMAYNEAASLKMVADEITAVVQRLGIPYELLIIDDGSTDGTGEIADRLGQRSGLVRVVHHAPNGGLGAVYRTGFAEARGRYLTFFPADGQFSASSLERLLAVMPSHDMVLGYIPRRPGMVLSRMLSLLERLLYRALFGSLPTFQGVMMFRRGLLEEIELESQGRGWAVLMELIIRTSRGGYRITSIPTGIRPRFAGDSKVNNFRTIWANLIQVLELRRRL
jgi:glycosyltransferase involved in cell wall biosynthesis